jgi:hypothetical protein
MSIYVKTQEEFEAAVQAGDTRRPVTGGRWKNCPREGWNVQDYLDVGERKPFRPHVPNYHKLVAEYPLIGETNTGEAFVTVIPFSRLEDEDKDAAEEIIGRDELEKYS